MSDAQSFDRNAEAARYVLLRRLAPSMRHHLVVNLQPIGMIIEVMDRRLRVAEPKLADVKESAQKINGFARAALDASNDVITWLAPDEQRTVSIADGVRECLGLLATSLTFRGFALRNEVPALTGSVRRAAIRTLLTSALLYISDHVKAPADLALGAELVSGALALTLTLRPTEGEPTFTGAALYRQLTWDDLSALAAAESVQVERVDAYGLRVVIPLAAASAD